MQFLKYSFLPLTLLTVFGLTAFLLTSVSKEYFVLIPVVVNLLLVIWFVICERLIPYRRDWLESKKDVTSDAVRTFVVLPTASKLAEWSMPFILFLPLVWINTPPNYFMAVLAEEYGLIVVFVIALLCCEFLYYWCHRLFHHAPFFWRFHAVHHGASRVYWLNAGRFHGIEAFISSFIYFLPLVLLNVPLEVSTMIVSVSAVTGFVEHVNVDFKAGFLNYIFNTADLHRWHHSKIIAESNRNYGKVLVIWDQLFFTFFLPKNRKVEKTGIVEDDVPADFMGQLKYPFTKK